MGTYVLAIDLGTSSVRAMIVDEKGKIICKEQTKYDVIIVSKYMQEQNPDEIYRYFVQTTKDCVAHSGVDIQDIKAIAFSSQMYNIFPINKAGIPLYNMILWSDSRSEEQAERLAMIYGKEYLYESTGCPLNSMYPLSKIMWLRENEEKITADTYKYISIKEYITQKKTGKYMVDYSMASGTGMFNIHTLEWDNKALGILGISEENFSEPVSGEKCFAFTNDELRENLGLAKEIQVVLAGGDGPLANIGSGAYNEGCINVDLGTSGAARVITHKSLIDSRQSMWTYAVTENSWVYGGILSNAGNGYSWLIRNIAEFAYAKSLDEIFEVVDKKIKKLPPAQDNLLFIPYLIKCRSPYWDDKVKATIYGLTHEHTFVDIVKSYLESIGFDLFSLVNIINEQVKVLPRIIVTGGLAKSSIICQLLADILGKEIVTLNSSEGSIMGAAIFGLKAIGSLKTLKFDEEMEIQESYKPHMTKHIEYQKKYVKYIKLRNALHDLDV